jgi:hypothetical protein
MKMKMIACGAGALLLAGCAMTQTQAAADLNAAFNVAAAGEAAYAVQPGANPKIVAQMSQLLSAAQAALLTWTNSQSTGDQATLNAAIAALVAYEAATKAA